MLTCNNNSRLWTYILLFVQDFPEDLILPVYIISHHEITYMYHAHLPFMLYIAIFKLLCNVKLTYKYFGSSLSNRFPSHVFSLPNYLRKKRSCLKFSGGLKLTVNETFIFLSVPGLWSCVWTKDTHTHF